MAHKLLPLLALPLVLAACAEPGRRQGSAEASSPTAAAASAAAQGRFATVVLQGVPHVRQRPDFCGEACAEMALRWNGKAIDQEDVFDISGLDPALARGVYAAELHAALVKLGFDVGQPWNRVPTEQLTDGMSAAFRALHDDLLAGIPSIVCTHFDDRPGTTEHFRLVVGYDGATDEVVYNEPAVDAGGYRRMKRTELLSLWPLPSGPDSVTVIRFRLAARKLVDRVEPVRVGGRRPAAWAEHLIGLAAKRSAGTTALIEPPFVVVGDDQAAVVRAHAARTVRWAVSRLEQDFFPKEPAKILTIWLFKGKESYERGALAITGEAPTTPYGFYSSAHDALVMNIATGGGTLVHEIVHPYIEANFPACPPWLNEGLGSLFEQSDERHGRIIGRTNWRLAGLKEAIRSGHVPPFEALAGANAHEFYEEDRGTNYAEARYLLYFLQEHELLVPFYRQFVASQASDPTGYATLQKVLGERDMRAFQARWESFVAGLRFPEP